MATSNKVFVSPGVYTSEKDLSYVSQSVGVSTLGLAGETLKGPAFEPILVRNYEEFKQYFGPTSPAKDGQDRPKYELPYNAKAYLQESNQLFVTRVLGMTGYNAGYTYAIKTVPGLSVYQDEGSVLDTLTFQPNDIPESLMGDLSITQRDGETRNFITYTGQTIEEYLEDNFNSRTKTGTWCVIGYVPDEFLVDLDPNKRVESPLNGINEINSVDNKEWYNKYYTLKEDGSVDKVISMVIRWVGGSTGLEVKKIGFDGGINENFTDRIVATLRSRGGYVKETLEYEVTGINGVKIEETREIPPFGDFTLTVNSRSGRKSFVCSMDPTSANYLPKVFGTKVFDKPAKDFSLYVDEIYPEYLTTAAIKGEIRGLSVDIVTRNETCNFAQPWDTTISPMVVSEVRGGQVADLFQVQTISDGDSANFEVKITIANINIDTGEFDLLVRDFNDSDDNPVILEKFTRCSMNPDAAGYIGRKVGTSDGDYELKSRYISLVLVDNHPVDAFPAGFKGFVSNMEYDGATLGSVQYKTTYFNAGDVFGYDVAGNEIITNGDKINKVSLGLSSQKGFDKDLLKYKGESASTLTKGFHLSKNADETIFDVTPYDLEGNDKGFLESTAYRKFTFAMYGGRDGWDIYRNVRTNTDQYIYGKKTYNQSTTLNGGIFSDAVPNSDYYAYLQGYRTFANPESVDINIFATPGINFYENASLVNSVIDMMETDRADTLYIINAPDVSTTEEVTGLLDSVSLDSNYSATYWPWIQVRDNENATQIYIPPTSEVLRNIALTDNVAYPWFATAGYQRGLVRSIKARKKLTLNERDELYKNRINPIATFSDTGTIIWGNKTLQVRESALDRINVRRLLLRARKLISAVAVRLLFEQNDHEVRNEFLRLTNPILESIKKERGLMEFKVVVSNDPEDIDANTLRGKIYVKPSRALEMIELDFMITPTGASFENV